MVGNGRKIMGGKCGIPMVENGGKRGHSGLRKTLHFGEGVWSQKVAFIRRKKIFALDSIM